MSTTIPPVTTTAPEDIAEYLAHHIWIPIVCGIALFGLIAAIAYFLCRHRRSTRCDYSQLKDELSIPVKNELEKQREQGDLRDFALLSCSFYMRNTGKYTLIDHLPDIGSRLNKQWFLVKDQSTGLEQLMGLMNKNTPMSVPFNSATRNTLNELVQLIKHPYVYPVKEIDFVYTQELVILVHAFNKKGSLKDFIYNSNCLDSWQAKYCFKSKGLHTSQVKVFGRQILEALLYMEEIGFPQITQLHSGNVILDDMVCRLSGYESGLLGSVSKLSPILRRKLRNHPEAMETLAFGHLLFEMTAGYELDSAHPQRRHLATIENTSVLEVLDFIFENPLGKYPSIRDIADHAFFSGVLLEELSALGQVKTFPSHVRSLLKSVRRKSKTLRRSKSRSSVKTGDITELTNLSPGGLQSFPPKPEHTGYGSIPRGVPTQKVLPTVSKPPVPGNKPPMKAPKPGIKTRSRTAPPPAPPPPAPPSCLPDVVLNMPAERTALLADIQKGVRLKKSAAPSRGNPHV